MKFALDKKTGLVSPVRRKLLKSLPYVAVAPFVIPSVARGMLLSGTAGANASPPVQPSLAATNGFNTNVLWDDFLSLSTIDINQTNSAGYKWYTKSLVFDGTTYILPAASFSVANSVLRISPTIPNCGWLNSVGYVGSSAPRTIGTPFAATGGYFESRIALEFLEKPFGAATSAPFINGPAFWLNDLQLQLDQGDHVNTSVPLGEIDIMEYIGAGGSSSIAQNVYQWSSYNGFGSTSPGSATPGSSLTRFHTYGLLWKTVSQGGGTGSFKFYVDGVNTKTVNYISSDPFMCFENSPLGHMMMIGTQQSWPIYIDYVQVWQ